jgi:hypothetical protein
LQASGPGRPPFTLKSIALCVFLALSATPSYGQTTTPKRLSDWLEQHKNDGDAYPLGLSWLNRCPLKADCDQTPLPRNDCVAGSSQCQ